MKVGDIVYSKYPKIHGEGHGIILVYQKSHETKHGHYFPAKAKIYWPITGMRVWIKTWDLYREEV
jgi:hypothetical protein